ncbi:MAG: hypothetical protein V3V02_07275 [Rhizobiaceae bacterium]
MFLLDGSKQPYGLAGLHMVGGGMPTGAITLYVGSQKPDRYGRQLVHAYQDDVWVQGALLNTGKALVYGLGLRDECLTAFHGAEKVAVGAKAGVWAGQELPIAADNLELLSEKVGHFTIIEGKVISVGDRSRRLYLNFGQKWSQDFTISVAKKGKGRYKGDVNRLKVSKNKTVQVRGILEERQGPLIRLFDEAQIIIMD